MLLFVELTEALADSALRLYVAHDNSICPISLSQPMIQQSLPNPSVDRVIADGGLVEGLHDEAQQPDREGDLKSIEERSLAIEESQQTSTLIEFPRAGRAVPEWRKQLSQRVRQVQERRAREAAEELAAAQKAGLVSCALPSAQLELVPDLEQQPMNPIVSKALERLERARRADSDAAGFTGTAAATALAPVDEVLAEPEESAPKPVETKHKLTVVGPSVVKTEPATRKPVRVIADGVDDAALSYLETCLSVPAVAADARNDRAGFMRRSVAATFDLLLVALLAAPFAAAIEVADGNWLDPRVIGLMTGISLLLMFAYLTVSVALTGRTLGMRLLSLRTIDKRTGLIPTGGQSIKRALAYILSLAVFGFGIMYALIDPDGCTIHDRFSKTRVIRD